jgi:hypothetical protein
MWRAYHPREENMNAIRFALPFAAAIAAAPGFAADDPLLAEARGVASAIPPKLLTVLQEEIQKGGAEGAIGVCREKAPAMAKAASEQTGWAIRRVSLKNRNPKAVPDAWEEAVLKDFDKRVATGEKPTSLEKGEVVTLDGTKSLSLHEGPADPGPLPAVPRHARQDQPGRPSQAEGSLPERQGGRLRPGRDPRRHHPEEAHLKCPARAGPRPAARFSARNWR